ncbi:MAG: hypothetical protein IIT46_14070 [Lachnospiraceae bacterium]|nr:hypothetical protein [Lachnospiraceae bacterium]
MVAGVAAAKGIKSDVKAFKKIAGAEKAAESAAKTSQRVADAESQLEKTAERTETTNPCTCKGNSQCFVAGTIIKTKLEVGDEILTSEGQKISIEKIEIEVLAEPVYVYNFTVEDFHTYFVSELGVYLLE